MAFFELPEFHILSAVFGSLILVVASAWWILHD